MILGIGADLCSIDRIQGSIDRFGDRFLDKVFTAAERARADTLQVGRAASYAKRFAAKEAFAKALGSGIRGEVSLGDIGVVNDALGRPTLALTGGAKRALDALAPPGHAVDIHLTLTDDPPWAQAFVVLSARALGPRDQKEIS
jgi:holo-[acyl-carrier protein] synthase